MFFGAFLFTSDADDVIPGIQQIQLHRWLHPYLGAVPNLLFIYIYYIYRNIVGEVI